jgi:hypothetical protein
MVRLHDTGYPYEDVFATMKARADLSQAALPHKSIDADDWIVLNYSEWLSYTRNSYKIGVPCTLYAEHFVNDWEKEPFTLPISMDDLRGIGESWKRNVK